MFACIGEFCAIIVSMLQAVLDQQEFIPGAH